MKIKTSFLLSFLLLFLALVPTVFAQGTSGSELEHDKIILGTLELLRKGSEREALEASLALQDFVRKDDFKLLVEALSVEQSDLALIGILRALGKVKNPIVGKKVRDVIKSHPNREVKLAGIETLGRLGHDWAVPILTGYLLNESDVITRMHAASSLGRLGTQQAIYALQNAKSRAGGGVRRAIRRAMQFARGDLDEKKTDEKLPFGTSIERTYKGVDYMFYRPLDRGTLRNKKPRLLVCVHGQEVQVEHVFNLCSRVAKDLELALLVPQFDTIFFQNFRDFNIYGSRADKFLNELISYVGKKANIETREIYLFGHEAGGDFATRYAMAYPKRIGRAAFVLAKPTMPDSKAIYPKGLKKSPYATDLSFDLYSIVKSDFGFIVSNAGGSAWEGRKFTESLEKYVEEQGLLNRYKVLQTWNDSLRSTWAVGMGYIFPEYRNKLPSPTQAVHQRAPIQLPRQIFRD